MDIKIINVEILYNFETVVDGLGNEYQTTDSIIQGYNINFIINSSMDSNIFIHTNKEITFEEIREFIKNQIKGVDKIVL